MTLPAIDLAEQLVDREHFIIAQITKVAVGAGGLESLILPYLGNDKVFYMSIPINQADFLSDGEFWE
jgi:hypothetical protein